MILKPFVDFSKNKNMTNKKQEIMKKYDSTSHFYDDRYSKIQFEKYQMIFKEISFEDKILLDAGCGTGLFFDFFYEHLKVDLDKQYHFLGVDISWNMLKEFLLKLKKEENAKKLQINLVLSDLENLPFRENVFHALFSLTSLQNLSNIFKGIKELFRVSRNYSDVKFSILKKKIDLDDLISQIKSNVSDLEIIESDDLEDIILSFTLQKKKQ